jgi:hypothetical protein
VRVDDFGKEENWGTTYSVHVYADDARAKIGCACVGVGDAWLVRADCRRQERSALELVVLRL